MTSTMEEGWGAQLPEEDNQSSDEDNFVDGDIRVRWRRRHWRDREADLRLRTAYANAIPFTLRMPNNVPNNGEVNAIMSEEDQAQRMISALYPEKDELLAKIEHVRELILMWHNMYDHKEQ